MGKILVAYFSASGTTGEIHRCVQTLWKGVRSAAHLHTSGYKYQQLGTQ